jgi:hypothetical protein
MPYGRASPEPQISHFEMESMSKILNMGFIYGNFVKQNIPESYNFKGE